MVKHQKIFEHQVDSLENVDVEVLAKAAGVVVEDGLGIPETLQDGKDLHGLEKEDKKGWRTERYTCQVHFAVLLTDKTLH